MISSSILLPYLPDPWWNRTKGPGTVCVDLDPILKTTQIPFSFLQTLSHSPHASRYALHSLLPFQHFCFTLMPCEKNHATSTTGHEHVLIGDVYLQSCTLPRRFDRWTISQITVWLQEAKGTGAVCVDLDQTLNHDPDTPPLPTHFIIHSSRR